jgi:hypothetical protein
MSAADRTLADYKSSGVTVGPHIMKYLRDKLTEEGVVRAIDLPRVRDGRWTKIAGLVIVRQRPGTAKGFCFLTLEDETGTANAVVVPDMFQRHRSLIHTAALLLVEGPIQKVPGPDVGSRVLGAGADAIDTRPPTPDTHFVIHIRARRFHQLELPQQSISLTGNGYRMRVTPAEPLISESRQPDHQQPPSLPKSHDFR